MASNGMVSAAAGATGVLLDARRGHPECAPGTCQHVLPVIATAASSIQYVSDGPRAPHERHPGCASPRPHPS